MTCVAYANYVNVQYVRYVFISYTFDFNYLRGILRDRYQINTTHFNILSRARLTFKGTGCNACYLEKIENVELFNGDKSKPYVIVNTEWGALGDDGTLNSFRTKYDLQIDNKSINSGKQT